MRPVQGLVVRGLRGTRRRDGPRDFQHGRHVPADDRALLPVERPKGERAVNRLDGGNSATNILKFAKT
jgi:hypothetical protein